MKIQTLISVVLIYVYTISNVFAMNSATEKQLQKLDLKTRLEQYCDIVAMERISKETKYSSDKVLAYAFSDPITSAHQIQVKGGAFRAKGKWYKLAYTCKTDNTNMKILSFQYKIGALIPKSEWNNHYLVP